MTLDRRAVLGGLAAAPFAGSRVRARTSDWDAVAAAAAKEGVVVVYNTGLGLRRDIAKAFTARHGINVEFLDMRASELRERVRIERRAVGEAVGNRRRRQGGGVPQSREGDLWRGAGHARRQIASAPDYFSALYKRWS